MSGRGKGTVGTMSLMSLTLVLHPPSVDFDTFLKGVDLSQESELPLRFEHLPAMHPGAFCTSDEWK